MSQKQELPKYTTNKKKGNIGESVVQYILSHFCLVHSIDGSNDIGNDFICELIRGEYPTNLLFYVQVKYTETPPSIRRETLNYWKGSPIPVFVFWIKDENLSAELEGRLSLERLERLVKYKRFTPFLHRKEKQSRQEFEDFNRKRFLRDLLSDYSRTQYIKGNAPVLEPRDFLTMNDKINLGLSRYQLSVKEIVPEYRKQIIDNGWNNLYALAVALYKRNRKKRALETIELAINIISKKQKDKHSRLFNEMKQTHQEWLKEGGSNEQLT